MTYYDANGRERDDRIMIGYTLTDNAVTGINLACFGETPTVGISLSDDPIELDLVTGSVTALSQLIDALYEARKLLEDHQIHHATGNPEPWTQEPLYIPDEWTGGTA